MKSSQKTVAVRVILLLVAGLTLAACSPSEPPDTHPGQPVTKRKQAFKEIVRTFEPMGLMVRGRDEFNQAEFLANAQELQRLAQLPWAYFTPDSNYPPTRAKEAVWSRNAEFRQAGEQFVLVTAELAGAAKTGDRAAIDAAYQRVHQSCQSCHREFRGTKNGEQD